MPKTLLLARTKQLLTNAVAGDTKAYWQASAASIGCFTPDVRDYQTLDATTGRSLVFDGGPQRLCHVHMMNPHVQLLAHGRVAVVAYVRRQQSQNENGSTMTTHHQETRVWERQRDGSWLQVHVHRSPLLVPEEEEEEKEEADAPVP